MSGFLDANPLVRPVSKDDPAKAKACYGLLGRARRGDVALHTSEGVLVEVVFVLTSPRLYGQPRRQVARALRPVIGNPGLRLDHKASVLAALDRWTMSTLDFVDRLAIEHALREDGGDLYSYDKAFDRIAGIQRLAP